MVTESLTAAGIGLVDIAAIDVDDGGLDDEGVDRAKFPRPGGHQTRAEQASADWATRREHADITEFDTARLAESTMAKYAANWQIFGGWCHTRQIEPLAADGTDIRAWIVAMTETGLKVSTIEGRLAAVRWHFDDAGVASPTTLADVAGTLEAARRRVGTASRRARPLLLDELRRIIAGIAIVLDKPPDHIRVLRDRALLTLGWGAALRVSELVGLNIEDLAMYGDPDTGIGGGVVLHISRSKTDQHGAGVDVGVPYSTHLNSCPVRSTMMLQRKLMDVTNRDPLTGRRLPDQTNTGPLFRSIRRSGRVGGRLSRQSVDTLIRFYIETVLNIDPTGYSTHSLRAGFVTECSNQDVAEHKIRRTTRHTSSAGLNPYDRPTEHFNNAALQGDWW